MSQTYPISVEVILNHLAKENYQDALTLMGRCKIDFSWQNHLIFRESLRRWELPPKTIHWVLEKGRYDQRHRQVALCMYAHLGEAQKVKELIKQGVNHEDPPQGWDSPAISHALPKDHSECFELLIAKSTYPLITYGMNKAVQAGAANSFIKGLAYVPKNDMLLATLWDKWADKLMPINVQQALVKRADYKILEKLIQDKSAYPEVLKKELVLRDVKKLSKIEKQTEEEISI